MPLANSRNSHGSLCELFRTLADPTRLRLLNLIADQEVCVCYLVAVLRAGQPKISRHLSYLRRAGIVAARREGKWMHYRLILPRNKAAAGVLGETLERLRRTPTMRRDAARLRAACCE